MAVPSMENESDAQLLGMLEDGLPLVRDCWAAMAERFGGDSAGLPARIARLKEKYIREISGVFDARALGYDVTLAAFAVSEGDLDAAGECVAGHPGVSHCYGREGKYNLWFTLAVSPDSKLGLQRTADILAEQVRADAAMILPTLKRYKLNVRFGGGMVRRPSPHAAEPKPPTEAERRAIRALQMDLPLVDDPFGALADESNLDTDELLVMAKKFLADGRLRRYAAGLRHRELGVSANVLVAWEVADETVDAAGEQCARFPAVSHCYRRPRGKDWPYTLYTMVHGLSRQDCAMTIDEIISITGLGRHADLWTGREYKKMRARLFDGAEARWESPYVS